MSREAFVRCADCLRVTPESRLSTSGPIKEIDEDGNLSRRWFHVCPYCFGADLQQYRRPDPLAEIEAEETSAPGK